MRRRYPTASERFRIRVSHRSPLQACHLLSHFKDWVSWRPSRTIVACQCYRCRQLRSCRYSHPDLIFQLNQPFNVFFFATSLPPPPRVSFASGSSWVYFCKTVSQRWQQSTILQWNAGMGYWIVPLRYKWLENIHLTIEQRLTHKFLSGKPYIQGHTSSCDLAYSALMRTSFDSHFTARMPHMHWRWKRCVLILCDKPLLNVGQTSSRAKLEKL